MPTTMTTTTTTSNTSSGAGLRNGRKAAGQAVTKMVAEKSSGTAMTSLELIESQRVQDVREVAMELCVDTLMAGCVSAFVEFFTLSHRDPVCVDELANTMFSVPMDRMPSVQGFLVQAEKARRATEYREVYDCYLKLANYFEDERDFQAAVHFHQLALDSVKQSGDKELQGLAHENFGHAHERLGNTEVAIKFHEAHLKLAEAVRNTALKNHVHANLVRVYMRRARECEKAADYGHAREMYEKSMNAARASGDAVAEGEAYHQLGNITVLLGDLDKALEYQKRFLAVSKETRSETNEGKANVSLAELHEEMGQVSAALTSLLHSLDIAERKADDEATCEACSKLGQLYNKSGDHAKAVQYLEKNYEVSKRLGDKERLERARILLGVAKGHLIWRSGFVSSVDQDVGAILKWKSLGAMPLPHGR
eukprot:EG_transcript_8562